MKLSESFGIDPEAGWVKEHNREVRRVLGAWKQGLPGRIPLICDDSTIQHGVYAQEEPFDYAEYYTNPDEMVRVQLEAARLRRELPIYDMELGVLPDSWIIVVDFWPVPSQGWLGCPIRYRTDAAPVHTPLSLSRRRGTPLPSGWHYCGSGMHLIRLFAQLYPLERLDDLTYPLLDIGEVRRIFGRKAWIKAGIIHAGPSERIREVVQNLMATGIADEGRFCLSVGDMLKGTPMEHRKALYAAVREFG